MVFDYDEDYDDRSRHETKKAVTCSRNTESPGARPLGSRRCNTPFVGIGRRRGGELAAVQPGGDPRPRALLSERPCRTGKKETAEGPASQRDHHQMAGAPIRAAAAADVVLASTTPVPFAPSFEKPPARAAARAGSYAVWEAALTGDHDALARLAEAEAERDAPRVAPMEESGKEASSASSLFVSLVAGAHKRLRLWTLVCARKPPQSVQHPTPPQSLAGPPQHCFGARKSPRLPGSRSATSRVHVPPATLPPFARPLSASAPASPSTPGPPAASAKAAAARAASAVFAPSTYQTASLPARQDASAAAEPLPQPLTAEELARLWCEEVLVEVLARP